MPEIGEKLFQYNIEAAIGSGGMGEVYLAHDTKLGRKAALKFLSAELSSDREHLARFLREARAASSLNHPNICTIYEINDSAQPPYIAMEFVEGETLAQMIRRRRRSPLQAVEIALQVADALSEAHDRAIVHRDIKPANIIVGRNGRVKILDFGLAKQTITEEFDSAQFQTNAGVVLGTASYMSPEQARGFEVDGRSDIWSLGVCLYEMLTGLLPFKCSTVADTFAAILTRDPEPPSKLVSEIPPQFDDLVLRMLRRSTDERYRDLRTVIATLRSIQQGLLGQAGPHEEGKHADDATEVFDTAPTIESVPHATEQDAVRRTAPNNLSAVRERLIGREAELAEISRILLDPEVRLVTMTGIGGTGKTTLSRVVARSLLREFPDGVFFIEMAEITRPEDVIAAIASPLGVKDDGTRPVIESLSDLLASRKVLLVIDNFEQIVEAAAQLSRLIAAAQGLKLLVTSREVLRLSDEVEFRVPPLFVPESAETHSFDELRDNPAVSLFAERASAARPGFGVSRDNISDIAALCSRLEGLPLAIELAAARAKILSPAAILSRLENRLNLLSGGSRDRPERQQTMRGAVMWSYDLLSEDEKAAFRDFSSFSGGFRIEAAEAVHRGPGDVLEIVSSLVDKSLLTRKEMPDGEFRFRMLDVVRDFAEEMLETEGDAPAARGRHAAHFVDLCETAEPLLHGASSDVWLAKLAEEHDNLRAAMEWSLRNAPELAVRLAASARNYWLVRSHLTEGFNWLKAASESDFQPPAELRFKLLNGLGLLARFRGDMETARRAYEAGLAAGEEAASLTGTALSHRGLGLVAMQTDDHAKAAEHFGAGLRISRELDDKYGVAMSLSFLGDLARTQRQYPEAKPMFEEAVGLFRELGNKTAVSDALNNLAAAEYGLGEISAAAAHFSEALAAARELSNRITISCSLDGLAAVAMSTSRPETAARLAGAADEVRRTVGYSIEPAEARFREDYVSKLRSELGEVRFGEITEEGSRLELSVAADEASNLARETVAGIHDLPL